MGIDWMTRDELSESIPPAYSEFIGRAALAALPENPADQRKKEGQPQKGCSTKMNQFHSNGGAQNKPCATIPERSRLS